MDDAELGDDPFAQGDAPVGVDAGTEVWLNSDRDYTYQEVGDSDFPHLSHINISIAPHTILLVITRCQSLLAVYIIPETLHNCTAFHPS
jgi:hypothetical protein